MTSISGNIVDIHNETIFPGRIHINNGIITGIEKEKYGYDRYILPGFVDSHVHIESSMLTPAGFARLAVVHGTVATVSDPHEIANILGLQGIDYMIENGAGVPFIFSFGAPSCVPASPFELSGSNIGISEIQTLLYRDDIGYLGEMMNYPGVVNGDPEVLGKIRAAEACGKPVDGHAPGLRGDILRKYREVGISTDHESFGIEEAREKVSLGMKILIREGSAAKNFDTLCTLITDYPEQCMFCTDDAHPDALVRGHINLLVKRAVRKGIDLLKVLRCACLNPVDHYRLNVGLLRISDPADMIVIDNLESFNILKTIVRGRIVAENGVCRIGHTTPRPINVFNATVKQPDDFSIPEKSDLIRVIEVIEGQIVTGSVTVNAPVKDGKVICDTRKDLLKISVVNRYSDEPPTVAFVRGFNLKRGAIASSIAHDSHNIIAVGASDAMLCDAVNCIIEKKGGISVVSDDMKMVLPLPIAGIMSDEDGYSVAQKYNRLNMLARELGCTLDAPFMTLSFMALVVIPKLKLSGRGLFDGERFVFTDLFV
ncbi:MAG: adenine deaminase [Syntrophorhabdaceae bacterium]|nr:adenine deaminase [Syntrophorhabdaceae bacterium]MDD4197144.1 adenine deaminase [Syntrophorhabdaceae bacterium]